MVEMNKRLLAHLVFIYGDKLANQYFERLVTRLEVFKTNHPKLAASSARERFSEHDAILITYGDMVTKPGTSPLRAQADFLNEYVRGAISTVHILPFFPYSSDDGFSVIDYLKVDPALGSWEDVSYLGQDYRLMFDAVINHISAQSALFRGYLSDDPGYQDHFITITPEMDLSNVFRPRALPLETPVSTVSGEKLVWTTFSADQIDLNYKNPQLLLDVMDVLLDYVAHGAEFIRLDAIAFIWKESGRRALHPPQAHRIVQLMRTVLDIVAPRVSIITETNVPHEDNISYFGDGANEAQMVYNFSLPPLTLHTFHTGNAEALSRTGRIRWNCLRIRQPSSTSWRPTTASGSRPPTGILTEAQITAMGERIKSNGGYVSYKNNPDGTQSAYELNINYLDALRDPAIHEEENILARRFLATQAIMLSLRGVPGIYFHSLFGSRNWPEGVEETGRYRSINRQKLDSTHLEAGLGDPTSLRHKVFYGYLDLLKQRTTHPAFHPLGAQKLLSRTNWSSPCGGAHLMADSV